MQRVAPAQPTDLAIPTAPTEPARTIVDPVVQCRIVTRPWALRNHSTALRNYSAGVTTPAEW